MFTIQYQAANGESRMQEIDTRSRERLAAHLVKFDRPILAVYEGSTLISKAIRTQIQLTHRMDLLSPACATFIKSPA